MPARELKSLDVNSVAIISAVLGAIYGLVGGLIYGTAVLIAGLPIVGIYPELMGVTAIVGGFFGGALWGFLSGAILAFLYNLIAGRIGGIKLNVE